MLVNSGDDRILSNTSGRNSTSILNNGKSTRGILRSKSDATTPRQRRKIKKNVRFSDCTDLEQLEYAINTQAERHDKYTYETVINGSYRYTSRLQLQRHFWLPQENELICLVDEKCVHLESVRWFGRAITGVVRVKNLAYEKNIEILYTFDNWTTSCTVRGTYTDSPSREQDRFSFCIFLPFLKLGMHIYFCVKYECGGMVYWNSYCNENYKFTCLAVMIYKGNDNNERTILSHPYFNPFDSDYSILF
uniref:CBM21 domain-containing protein n=1 Tax=Onchocerca volvulus TaxID=6282 RepID=A0A8R1TL71_ONCVO